MIPSEMPIGEQYLCQHGVTATLWLEIFVLEKVAVSGSGRFALFKTMNTEINGVTQTVMQWRALKDADQLWKILEKLGAK